MFRPLIAGIFILAATAAHSQGNWELLSPFGIQANTGDKWIAGRTSDVLEITPEAILVATDGSGVWWVQSNLTVPLSREWDSTDMFALAKNPSPGGGYFAGGIQGGTERTGVLYQTKPFERFALFAPWQKVPLPAGTLTVNRILTITDPPRIILATSSGLLWSYLPTLPTEAFQWKAAEGASMGGFYDVAQAGEGIVVGSQAFTPAQGTPVRLGSWETRNGERRLLLRNTIINPSARTPVDLSAMFTTSVAVAPSNPRIMYCVSADGAGRGLMSRFYRSENGGLSWQDRQGSLSDDGSITIWSQGERGEQGNERNNTLAVSPTDPNTVVLGWVHSYISTNGGQRFTKTAYTHDDHARFRFFGNRLYDCCDGGIMVSTDNGRTFSHRFNQKLATLQFYPQGFDALGVGYDTAGGGLQDNNVAVISWEANSAAGPWRFTEGPSYDGGFACFLPGGVVFCDGGGQTKWAPRQVGRYGNPVVLAHINASPQALGGGSLFLGSPRTYKVFNPARANANGDKMVALGFVEGQPRDSEHACWIFGLFFKAGEVPHWEQVASIRVPANDGVQSLASYNGNQIYVGFAKNGQLWRVNTDDSRVTVQQGFPQVENYLITEIVAPWPNEAFAVRNERAAAVGRGALYALGQNNIWVPLSGLPDTTLGALAAENPQVIYVANANTVYKSSNDRSRWENFSVGLPARPRPTSMRIVKTANNRRYLYMSTFGWSVWRRSID